MDTRSTALTHHHIRVVGPVLLCSDHSLRLLFHLPAAPRRLILNFRLCRCLNLAWLPCLHHRVGCWCGSKVYVHMGPSDAAQWLLMGKLFRLHSNILAKNCSSFKYELAQCGFHTFLSAYHRVLYLSTCLSVSPTKTLSNSKIFLVSTFVVYMSHVFS